MDGPPALVGWLLVILGAAVGLSCLARTRFGREEALTGVGMAAMAVPVSAVDTRPWGPVLLTAVFAFAGVRSVLRAHRTERRGHHVHHVVCAVAMVHTAAAMAGPGPDSAMDHGPGAAPLLTGLLVGYFAAYALAAGVRLTATPAPAACPAACPATDTATTRDGAELASACRVAMALGMVAMLLTM